MRFVATSQSDHPTDVIHCVDIWRNTDTFYMESSRNRNAQQVMVTFSYTFGQPSQRERQRDDRGGEPEGDFDGEGYQ